jgi:choline dehydrogenase
MRLQSVTFTEPSPDVVGQFGYTWDASAYGGSTPIYSSYPPFQWPIQSTYLRSPQSFHEDITNKVNTELGWKAWEDVGVKARKECAGGDKDGLCWVPTSQHPVTARRSYAGLGHYAAVNTTRPNYDLLVKHKVRRMVYPAGADPKSSVPMVEIVGLEDEKRMNLTAKLEVVLSTGAIHTPQILQRSGIGAAAFMKSAGIDLVADLPGVGYNFQDHAGPPSRVTCEF